MGGGGSTLGLFMLCGVGFVLFVFVLFCAWGNGADLSLPIDTASILCYTTAETEIR